MDFEAIKAMPLGDALNKVVTEGGATVIGFGGAGILGRQIQNRVIADSAIVTSVDKLKAWAANNLPKIGAWYLLRGRPIAGESTGLVNLGIVTSVAFDTLMRLLNAGRNPATALVGGYEILGEPVTGDAALVQRLMLENQQLRQGIVSGQTPMDPRLPPYVGGIGGVEGMQVVPPAERERKYSFMQPAIPGMPRPPGTASRERKFGFAGEVTAMGAPGGRPGAAYVQAGKMFGMQ